MNFFLLTITSILLTMVGTFVAIPILKRIKVQQTVLEYVDNHKGKQGTVTMGGVVILLSSIFSALLFIRGENTVVTLVITISVAIGIIGFLDDFIKVYYKRNLGLMAYQKIIAQVVIAAVASYCCFKVTNGEVLIPFLNSYINMGKWIIPLSFFVFIALVNTVNLTDGLDGLAVATSSIYLVGIIVILGFYTLLSKLQNSLYYFNSYSNLLLFALAVLGSILAFSLFNTYPAKVFMGDTGSMYIGGVLATLAIFTKNILFVPFFGLPFVVSGLSDIIQVCFFKATKGKRVFKMAPYHHHLERSGVHENVIVRWYFVISLIVTIIVLGFFFRGKNGII